MLGTALVVVVAGLATWLAAVSWIRDEYKYEAIKMGVFTIGSIFAFFGALHLAALIWGRDFVGGACELILYLLTLQKIIRLIDRAHKASTKT